MRFKTYLFFWVGLFESTYKQIALKALQQLVLMTTMYMSEKGFSSSWASEVRQEGLDPLGVSCLILSYSFS